MGAKRILLSSLLLFSVIFGIFQYKKRLNSANETAQIEQIESKKEISSNRLQVRALEDLEGLPLTDRIDELFAGNSKLPIVETVRYTSRAKWLPGKSAWLSDYAAHFNTSKHFIARSANGKASYLSSLLRQGDQFNVYSDKRPIEYHVVVDLSRCRAWLFYHDKTTSKDVLLKTYLVGLGKLDEHKKSGSLTPIGVYQLGDKIATYKPQKMDHYKGRVVEMIRLFGTRWIPFDKEIANCSDGANRYGLHGCPWEVSNDILDENRSNLGKYTTDGCIHFAQEDIEEIYAIVVTKPTYVHVVKDFHEANLPGEYE